MEERASGRVAGTQVPSKHTFFLLTNAHFPFPARSDPNSTLPDLYPHHLPPPRIMCSRGPSISRHCTLTHLVPNAWDAPFPVLQITNFYSHWRPSLRCHFSSDPMLDRMKGSVLCPQSTQFLGLLQHLPHGTTIIQLCVQLHPIAWELQGSQG